eukprot:6957577-Lingulodinium_polyedra.AAC.1
MLQRPAPWLMLRAMGAGPPGCRGNGRTAGWTLRSRRTSRLAAPACAGQCGEAPCPVHHHPLRQ